MKAVLATVAAVVLGVGAIAGAAYLTYFGTAFFAPRYEAVRRDVMIESRAYSEATIRELYRLKSQYEATADDAARATIVAAALHEFSIFPKDRLPLDLQGWLIAIGG